MAQTQPHTPLILYDGVCNLCTGTVIFVIKRDRKRRFKFASLQSALGQELLRQFGFPTDDFKTFVLVTEDGHFTRSTAVLKVAKELNGLWPLLYALIIIPRPIRDIFYNYIARNRYRLFGKKEACLVPSPDIRDRFLDWREAREPVVSNEF